MSNYKAMVAKIDKVVPIEGADRIHTAFILGEQVVVSKEWGEGKIGIFFTSDTQLSKEFMQYNNLYRDNSLNRDNNKKGFFDTNRRVRCQPFLKVRSEGFFCETSSLVFCGENHYLDLKIGDQFDKLNGYDICQKYLNEKTINRMNNLKKNSGGSVTETPMFNKHMDTEQFKHYVNKIAEGDLLNFHAKVHGTSARYSYSKVINSPITFMDKLMNKFGLFKSESWEFLTGTRNVVLHEKNYTDSGSHGSEQYRFDVMESLKPFLEKGMSIYGEIAGFANGKPIMNVHTTKGLKDKSFKGKYGDTMTYKYGCVNGTSRFHIYRISFVNEDGIEIDYTNDQVIAWCTKNGFNPPLAVSHSLIYNGDKDALVTLVDDLTERNDVLTEDYIDPSHVSEGIIIRIDNEKESPTFYKSKSYAFKVMEGILKESGDVDIEEVS